MPYIYKKYTARSAGTHPLWKYCWTPLTLLSLQTLCLVNIEFLFPDLTRHVYRKYILFTAIVVVWWWWWWWWGGYRPCVPTVTAGSYKEQTLQPCLVVLRADLWLPLLHALFNALLRGVWAVADDRGEVTPLSVPNQIRRSSPIPQHRLVLPNAAHCHMHD